MTEQQQMMKPGEVAALFQVHLRTVARWADDGLLRCVRTPGGQRRYWREDVDRFMEAEREDGQ
jgi:excisionase family DNA binding protein